LKHIAGGVGSDVSEQPKGPFRAAAPKLRHVVPVLLFPLCAAAWFTYWRSVPALAPPAAPRVSAAAADPVKPALLVFISSNDPRCVTFQHDVFDDIDVQAYVKANFLPIVVDVSKTHTQAISDGESLPRLVLLDDSGHETRRGSMMEKSSLLQWLKSASTGQAALVSR
jgi:hypothetical protein